MIWVNMGIILTVCSGSFRVTKVNPKVRIIFKKCLSNIFYYDPYKFENRRESWK